MISISFEPVRRKMRFASACTPMISFTPMRRNISDLLDSMPPVPFLKKMFLFVTTITSLFLPITTDSLASTFSPLLRIAPSITELFLSGKFVSLAADETCDCASEQ